MRQTLTAAAALVIFAAPAFAQNFTIPAGDAAFTRATAEDYLVQHGYVALAPQADEARPAIIAPHRSHRSRSLAD